MGLRTTRAVVFASLIAFAACTQSEQVTSDSGPTPSTEADDADTGEVTTTRPKAKPKPKRTTTTTEAVDTSPKTPASMITVGNVVIPDGEPGKLSVVLHGPLTGSGTVAVVVRNRTDKVLHDLAVTGTARGADGTLVGSGASQGLAPGRVDPGEWAFGYVFFSGEVPDGASYDLTATGGTDAGYVSSTEIPIVEVNQVQGDNPLEVVGIVENPTDEALTYVWISVACFDGPGTGIVHAERGSSDADQLQAKGTGSFSLSLYGVESCANFAAAATGF